MVLVKQKYGMRYLEKYGSGDEGVGTRITKTI